MLCSRPFQSVVKKKARCKGSSIASRLCHHFRVYTCDIVRGYRYTFIIHDKDYSWCSSMHFLSRRNDDKNYTFFFHEKFIDFNYNYQGFLGRSQLLDLESFEEASIKWVACESITLRIWLSDSFRKWIINGEIPSSAMSDRFLAHRDCASHKFNYCDSPLRNVLIWPIWGVDVYLPVIDVLIVPRD